MFFASVRSAVISLFVTMFWSIRCTGFATTRRLRVFSTEQRTSHPIASIGNELADPQVDPGNDEGKHWVQWTTEEGAVKFEVYDGELLRTAALRRGVVTPHNGKSKLINCRGLGTCGTCAVEVRGAQGAVVPRERNGRERLRLSFPPHNPVRQSPYLRLACQIQVYGDLQVTKRSGFWGQSKDLSPSSEYQTYFGDVEFLLDNISPKIDR